MLRSCSKMLDLSKSLHKRKHLGEQEELRAAPDLDQPWQGVEIQRGSQKSHTHWSHPCRCFVVKLQIGAGFAMVSRPLMQTLTVQATSRPSFSLHSSLTHYIISQSQPANLKIEDPIRSQARGEGALPLRSAHLLR